MLFSFLCHEYFIDAGVITWKTGLICFIKKTKDLAKFSQTEKHAMRRDLFFETLDLQEIEEKVNEFGFGTPC